MMEGVANKARGDVLERERKALGERLGRLRIAAGLGTQQALSDASGVSLRQVAAYERGESLPRWEQAIALAQALGVSLDELAGREPRAARPLQADEEEALAVLASGLPEMADLAQKLAASLHVVRRAGASGTAG